MVILRTRNKITDFLMILAWASPFKKKITYFIDINRYFLYHLLILVLYDIV